MLKRLMALLIGVVILLGAIAPAVFATPEKAKKTGKKCKDCHEKVDHEWKPAKK